MAIRIADLPDAERPRERLVRVGAPALSDRELLALVLRSGAAGRNAVEVGATLMSTWGSLDAIAAARYEDLMRVQGLGPAKTAGLVAAFELGRRSMAPGDACSYINGPEDLLALVRPILLGRPQEEVVVVVMNSAHKPLRTVELTRGGADRCMLTARDALSAVLRNDGTAFALAHNHPSGNPAPSPEDARATRAIAEAAALVGLRLIDHVIVAGPLWTSMQQQGLLVVSQSAGSMELQ
ncbi:DNA repair protein RadC [soil metagenome]